MNVIAILDAARVVLGAELASAGVIVIAGGVLGLLRFPDAYTRVHASNVAHIVGAPVFVLGMAALADSWQLAARLIALAMLIAAAAPMIAHLATSAAHAAGLTPITGAYQVPRPGARSPGRSWA